MCVAEEATIWGGATTVEDTGKDSSKLLLPDDAIYYL